MADLGCAWLMCTENQRQQLMELCADRLLPRDVAAEGRRWCQLSES